jgi:hypothetical protein
MARGGIYYGRNEHLGPLFLRDDQIYFEVLS